MEISTASLAKEEFLTIDINELNNGPTNIFHIETCPLTSLTVYTDKAELCRKVKPQLKLGKVSMIIFKKISPAIDKDSFRVDVSGPGIIRDVFYRALSLPDDERNMEESKKLIKSKMDEDNKRLKLLNAKITRLRTQRSVIDGFSETLIEKRDDDFKSRTCAFDPKHMDTLGSFLNLYDNQVEKIDTELMQTQEQIINYQKNLELQEQELRNLETKTNELLSRELSVILECKEMDPITLQVSYIVNNSQWSPSYDIRVYSNDGNMKIIYYGQVQQCTGEDWEPQVMFLSNSEPGVGENVPQLAGQSIKFKEVKRRPQKIPKSKRMSKALSFHAKDDKMRLNNEDNSNLCFSDDNMTIKECELLKSPIRESVPTQSLLNGTMNSIEKEEFNSKVESNNKSSSLPRNTTGPAVHFTVPKTPVIIPGDQLPHRAIVGVIDLHPTFEYSSVPKRTPYAFLKANCHNGSPFAILPGPANIFIDNNFIGKTTLTTVAPQEDFTCNLGVDHGIKINYKPIFKYRDQSASNSRTSIITFKQLIEIKNEHELNVRLILKDQLPVSGEDKIKINLQEPLIKQSDKNKQIKLTKSNIVEWELELHPNEYKELTLKYSVEFPANEEIDVAFLNNEL